MTLIFTRGVLSGAPRVLYTEKRSLNLIILLNND
jgi:hypothetical protein